MPLDDENYNNNHYKDLSGKVKKVPTNRVSIIGLNMLSFIVYNTIYVA